MSFSKSIKVVLVMLVVVLDLLLTFQYQPDCYWDDHRLCVEKNPIGRAVLCAGPGYFVALSCVWLLTIFLAVTKLPRLISLLVIIAVLLGHGWGSASWLHHVWSDLFLDNHEWHLHIVYYGLIVLIMIWCVKNTITQKPSAR